MKTVLPIIFVLVFSALSSLTVNAQKLTVLGHEPVIIIDKNSQSGSALLSLRNDSPKPVNLLLSAGTIINVNLKKVIPAQILFSLQGEENYKPVFTAKKIKTDSILTVKVKVNSFNAIGEYTTTLLNNNEEVAHLTIIGIDFPLNLSLDVPNPNSPEITFRRGKEGLIVLKNDDGNDYYIDLSLHIKQPGEFITDTGILCKAGITTPVSINIPSSYYSSAFSGLFRDEVKEANLALKYKSAGNLALNSPSKMIPLKIKLQYYDEGTKIFWSNLIIFFVLALGGAVSLFLNLWIPNRLKRNELKKRLNKIHTKTRSISNNVKSDLRVNIMVERMRLDDQVAKTRSLNPNFDVIYKEYLTEINRLEKRVELIRKLDVVNHFFENMKGKAQGAPVKIMDDVNMLLDGVNEILKLPLPDSESLLLAEKNIQSANEMLSNMPNENDALAELLAKNVVHLGEVYKNLINTEKYKELKPKLKTLLSLVDPPDSKYKDKKNILPVHYHWLNSTVERLYVLRHYIETWENHESRRAIMATRENEFIDNLNNRTWYALNLARQFRKQFTENVYASDIINALKEKAFTLDMCPIQPRQNQPVNIEVVFENEILNASSARNDITCIWDFRTIGKEKGWRILHYFRNNAEAVFSVYFNDRDGTRIKLGEEDHYPVSNLQILKAGRPGSNGRTKIEVVKFLVAFLVALLALNSGAKEQLMNLDLISGLIAVFIMGFSADTIKNLITRQPSEE